MFYVKIVSGCVKMRITKVSYNQNMTYNKPAMQPAFSGLTRTFEKAVYAIPYKKAEQLVDMYDKPNLFVGYFPKDIMDIFRKSAKTSFELKQKIQTFNKGLADLAVGIRTAEDSLIENLDTVNLDEYTYRALSQATKRGKGSNIGWVGEKMKIYLTPAEMEKQLNTSSFEENMRKIGLISDDEKLRFTFAGKGTYKKCFKLELLDANDKPIIHPKAFVIAQNQDIGWDCNRYLQKRIGNYLKYLGLKGFKKRMEQQMLTDTISEAQKEKIREMTEFYFNGHYKTSRLYDGATILEEYNNINGIFPEANAALKIRKDIKDQGINIEESNIITPYIFGLKSRFGLLEFSDRDVPWSRYFYDFENHGIEWLDGKYENYGKDCPKIIDFGSMVPLHLADDYRW